MQHQVNSQMVQRDQPPQHVETVQQMSQQLDGKAQPAYSGGTSQFYAAPVQPYVIPTMSPPMTGPSGIQHVSIQESCVTAETYKMSKATFFGLGLTQVLLGAVGCLVSIPFYIYGFVDVFYILAGAFGLAAARRPTRTKLLTCQVFCILSTFPVVLHVLGFVGLLFTLNYSFYLLIVSAIVMSLSIVEFLIAIVHASFCCRALGCCEKRMASDRAVLVENDFLSHNVSTAHGSVITHP